MAEEEAAVVWVEVAEEAVVDAEAVWEEEVEAVEITTGEVVKIMVEVVAISIEDRLPTIQDPLWEASPDKVRHYNN